MTIIQFEDVWEMYRIKFVVDKKISWDNFWALRGVNFSLEKGETLGIIGENGAGKSTILKLIMSAIKPDRGEIKISGTVSGLLELSAGFQPELTGRENVFLNMGLFGLNSFQIEKIYDEVVAFANIGKFINAPVKCYSQGMFVRLAFSAAVHINPDILVIDDILAVGDEFFQKKCVKKIYEIKEQNKNIIFVTHDMNLLKRFSKRALLIKDGSVFKDGPVDKAISFYSQLLGTREGVGILEKNHLKIIFNNGRLLINWMDKLLTPNSGAHTSFLISDKWYSSLQADWKVERQGENKLIATGKFYQLDNTQVWKLELSDRYILKWDIEIDSQGSIEIQEGYTNILLTDEYTSWFTTLEKGDFPSIDYQDKNWNPLLEEKIFRKCVGVEKETTPGYILPSLSFEQSKYSPFKSAQVLNTNYLINSRVLQYKISGFRNYSSIQDNRFLYFSGKLVVDVEDIDNYLKKVEEEFILSNGEIKLVFDNGRFILYYCGLALTKVNHISSSIYANGRWYFSSSARWEVIKQSANKLIVKGTWLKLGILQVWEVEIISETSFSLKVCLQINDPVVIEEQNVWFMCSDKYKYWFCDYDRGDFPDNFLEIQRDMFQKCIHNGEVGLASQNNEIPNLSIKFLKDLSNFAKVFNSDFYYKARLLRVDRVEVNSNAKYLPGNYPCFGIVVSLNKNRQLSAMDYSKNILEIGRLKLIFENGIGRIYWGGIEITKKLSLYTSLRSKNNWHDSASSAIWRIEEKGSHKIRAVGKWLNLPIIQFWVIELKKEKEIEININLRVEREIEVDRLQANLMLSEKYSQWITSESKGQFPLFKEDVSDDWDCVWSGNSAAVYAGVMNNPVDNGFLPSVIFFLKVFNPGWVVGILNSDVYHRGRVLQCLNSEKKKLLPADYLYLSCRITLDSFTPVLK